MTALPPYLQILHVPDVKGTTAQVVKELVEEGEEWLWGQDDVGLYHSNSKLPNHQTLSVQLTTHRLLFLQPPPSSSSSPSVQLPLPFVRQTEFYTGFLRSSAKISLFLAPSPSSSATAGDSTTKGEDWTCGVCAFINTSRSINGILASSPKCGLCGVTREIGTHAYPSRTSTPQPSAPPTPTTPSGLDLPCPRCTFLNHPSLPTCEICGAPLAPANGKPLPPPPREASKTENSDGQEIIRISFRKGGDKEMYRRLKGVLGAKAWETKGGLVGRRAGGGDGGGEGGSTGRAGFGIDGIIQNLNLDNKAAESDVQDAFKDLEALMIRAGEMVKLVQTLNSKLSTSSAPTSSDETFLRSSLVQLGLPTPAVTQDMVRGEREYVEGLARELGGLLTGRMAGANGRGKREEGLMVGEKGRGLIGLDEVWCVWNRARGVSLVPPKALRQVIPLLPTHTVPPITLLTFTSGLSVLHTPHYSPSSFSSRLITALAPVDGEETGLSTITIAMREKIAVGLAQELVERVEEEGEVVRDQGGEGGERWFRNLMGGWVWEELNEGDLRVLGG